MTTGALGIDFGTTTTVAAGCTGERPFTIEDASGRGIVPSVVAFAPGGKCLIGTEAKYRRPQDAENTLFSVKRLMGRRMGSTPVQEFQRRYPFKLEAVGSMPGFVTRAGTFTPEQVAAKIIAHSLALAKQRGIEATHLAVGVPVDFGPPQRTATLRAVELAGFGGVARCVDEPLAIARAFLFGDLDRPRRVAVYDLGGGTFDLAVCQVGGGACTLLASGGDAYLGGDDVDQLLATSVIQQVLEQHRWDFRTNPQAVTRLLAECERVKIALSTMTTGRVKLGAIEPTDVLSGLELTIQRSHLEDLCRDLVRRSFTVCDEVLARAGLRSSSIDEILLAGGSSQIPSVKDTVRQYFGKEPRTAAAPDRLVAEGAALVAFEQLQQKPVSEPAPEVSRQRTAPRLPTSLPLRVRLGEGEPTPAFASNIAKGGMFIAMPEPPALDTRLTLLLEVDDQSLSLAGRVVHRVSAEDASARPGLPPGIGVELVDLSPEDRAKLQSLLEHAATLFGGVSGR
jgi:molecular chaperone DnaK